MSAPFFSPAASACAVPALPPLTTRRAGALFLDDRGAATAEYAIATMAAVARKDVPKAYRTPLSCVSRAKDRRPP